MLLNKVYVTVVWHAVRLFWVEILYLDLVYNKSACCNCFSVSFTYTYWLGFKPESFHCYCLLNIKNLGKNIWSFEPDLNWNFVSRVYICRTSYIVHLRVGCNFVEDCNGNNKRLKETNKRIEISNYAKEPDCPQETAILEHIEEKKQVLTAMTTIPRS